MKDEEKEFIEANVRFLKALTDGDPVTLKQARQILMESMQRIMTLPADHVLTRAMVRRAKYLARDTPHKYLCPTCHKPFDDKTELLQDLEDHMIDFYAGIPTRLAPSHIKKLKQMVPKAAHKKLKYRVEKEAYKHTKG